MKMSHDELVKEIHRSWNSRKPKSYSIEIPPGCGASWLSHALVDDIRVNSSVPTKRIKTCLIDGRAFIQSELAKSVEWRFVLRLAREWDAIDIINKPDFAMKNILEEEDTGSFLHLLVRHLLNNNQFPVLVINLFDRFARALDSIIFEMRHLEQMHKLASAVFSPLPLWLLKKRWQNEDIFFVNSDYGDNHITKYVGHLSDDAVENFFRNEGIDDEKQDIKLAINSVLGNRAISYFRGINIWKEVHETIQKVSWEHTIKKFKSRLWEEVPTFYDRFLKWLRLRSSTALISSLAFLNQDNTDKRDADLLENCPWKDLLFNVKRNFINEGLASAAQKFDVAKDDGKVDSMQAKISNFCGSTKFRRRKLTPKDVNVWLNQFPQDLRNSLIAMLLVIAQDYFFNEDRISKYLERIYDIAINRISELEPFQNMGMKGIRKRIQLVKIQEDHKSEGRILHEFCLCNDIVRIRDTKPLELDNALKEWKSDAKAPERIFLCVDDFVGSGETGSVYLKKVFEKNFGKGKQKWPSNIYVFYLAVAGFDEGKKRIEDTLGDNVNVILGKEFTSENRAFSENSRIFTDTKIRNKIKSDFLNIGKSIYSEKYPFGYNNDQSFVVFHYRAPNNTLPPLIRKGEYRGKEWIPLFDNPK